MAGFIPKEDVIDPILQELLKELAGDVANITKEFRKLVEESKNLSASQGLKDIIEESKKAVDAEAQLAKVKKELAVVTAKLAVAYSNENIALAAGKEELKKTNAAVSEAITQKNELAKAAKDELAGEKLAIQTKKLKISAQNAERGSAQQLVAVNKILVERMKAINMLTVEGVAKYRQLDAAMQRNKGKIAEMNAAAMHLAMHGGKAQISMFRNLAQSIITYGAAYVSVQSVIQLAKSIFNQTKELDKLDFSLKAVIKDSDELALTQAYLSNVSTKYGADLLSITERYIKFRAAAIQANLSAIETQRIFDSVSKAAGVLGLKVDETAGIYLALEQMLSKGKVSTEELRRQLGERLPGAFGIMAKTIQALHPELKVTLGMLDKMLRNGEIMSAEVLPEFAVQIEKAYGIENVNKVDTLTAATQRLSTAWTEIIRQMQVSNPATWAIDAITNQMSLLSAAIDIVTNKGRNLFNIVQRIPFFSDAMLKKIKEYDAISMEGIEAENTRRINIGKEDLLWRQYYQQRITQEKLLQKETSKVKEFDVEKYKAEIEAKKKSYADLAKLTDKNSREEFKLKQNVLEENYKLELDAQLRTIKAKEMVAKYRVDKNPMDESAFFAYSSLTDAKLFLEMEMFDANKKNKGDEYTNLKKMQDNHKKELELLKENQQELLDEFEGLESERLDIIKTNNIAILNERRKQVQEEMKLANAEQRGGLSTELAGIGADIASVETKGNRAINKQLSKEELEGEKALADGVKKSVKELEDSNQMLSDFEVENSRAAIDKLQLEREEAGIDQLRATKGNADEILKVQQDLARDLIQIEIDQTERLLNFGEITTEERIRQERRLRDAKLAMAKEGFQTEKENTEKEKELNREKLRDIGEAVNAGFEFSQGIFSNQADAAKRRYDDELKAAGDNLEAKTIAERKYEAEDLKIRRRQAIADKLQAAFNIGLTLATATAKLNVFQIVVAALALAAVIAKPIPEYFKGTDSAPETFIGGDTPDGKGASELVELKSGKSFLTPDRPTLFSDPLFKGAKIYPNFHDKTQRMLNSYAVNQGASVLVDMSRSERSLEAIAKNTRNNETRGIDSHGKSFVRRGSVLTHL